MAVGHNLLETTNSSVQSYNFFTAANSVPRGNTTFLGNVRNSYVANIELSENDDKKVISEFLTNLLTLLFNTYRFPFTCRHQYNLDEKSNNQIPSIVVFNNKKIILVIEVKRESKDKKYGEDQVISYSQKILDMDKTRFMVLSMVCTANEFALFCTFRFEEDVAFVRLSDYDLFSFGSNGLGLIKLLYILQLPWPLYGLLPLVKKTGNLSILKLVRFLGSGPSAVVYEYMEGNRSFVFKFFRSIYQEQFRKEVEIYSALMNNDISKEMLWFNQSRCLICLRSVRDPVNIEKINRSRIRDVYQFLRDFHRVTGNVHRDIYFRNLLISSERKIYLNDFALSVLQNKKVLIKGNVYFASDAVLMSEDDEHVYRNSDDIYSLTFTLIYLIYEKHFPTLFTVSDSLKNICIKRKSLIADMECKDLVLSALGQTDYDAARDDVIKVLNFFSSKFNE
jgi:hypothetical protein